MSEMSDAATSGAEPITDTIEAWQVLRAVPPWKHLGAVRRERWGAGQRVTLTVYDAAIEVFERHPAGR